MRVLVELPVLRQVREPLRRVTPGVDADDHDPRYVIRREVALLGALSQLLPKGQGWIRASGKCSFVWNWK